MKYLPMFRPTMAGLFLILAPRTSKAGQDSSSENDTNAVFNNGTYT